MNKLYCFGLWLLAVGVGSAPGAVKTWNTTTGDWFLGANWNPTNAPEAGDDVVITNTSASVILSNTTPWLSSVTLNKTLTFTNWNSALNATNVTIQSGGVLTLPAAFTTNAMSNNVYVVCSNLMLNAGSSISLNQKGFTNYSGPGAGGWAVRAGGAGYGGQGGKGQNAAGGGTYGSITNPIDPGSGGGYANGGAGGGAIALQASGTITLNGTITANGGNGDGDSGAGSGGGIFITTLNFTGATNGAISANGGYGGSTAGGGGGGRIAVVYSGTYSYAGTYSAALGSGWTTVPEGLRALPGTIYLSNWNDLPSTINYGLTLPSGAYDFSGRDFVITNGATFMIAKNTAYTFNSLTLAGNSTVYCESDAATSNGITIIAGNITIASGSTLMANGFGFPSNTGPGKSANIARTGGAGYGGPGGAGQNAAGGSAYGSIASPIDPGSGAGYANGGYGGGAIALQASGTITLNGTIVANGGDGDGDSGAGSGGGIFITTSNLSGATNAAIIANGGNGAGTAGGGGGGRIAIITRNDWLTGETPGRYLAYAGSANGIIRVNGGPGYAAGTNGTFYLLLPGTVVLIR